jgi:chromosome segregation ATPase
MENEKLINAYIANLAKNVNDLTLENILLKSKQQNATSDTNEILEQVQRQKEEIQELKDTEERLRNENFDFQRKAKDDEDFISRLEEGIEQANGIIAQFEEEKNGALAKVARLEKEAKQQVVQAPPTNTKKLEDEKATLFNQNVKLLKDLDYAENKIKELKVKLRNKPKEESVNGDNNQTEAFGNTGLDTEFR